MSRTSEGAQFVEPEVLQDRLTRSYADEAEEALPLIVGPLLRQKLFLSILIINSANLKPMTRGKLVHAAKDFFQALSAHDISTVDICADVSGSEIVALDAVLDELSDEGALVLGTHEIHVDNTSKFGGQLAKKLSMFVDAEIITEEERNVVIREAAHAAWTAGQ
jgi:hypothetical protein